MGYQCSNFYRQLIREGEIHDDNYMFDENGKLVFKFRDRRNRTKSSRRNSPKQESNSSEEYDDVSSLPEEETNILPVNMQRVMNRRT